MGELTVHPDGSITEEATGRTWPDFLTFAMERGEEKKEKLGLKDIPTVKRIELIGQRAVAQVEEGSVHCLVTPEVAYWLTASDFGREEDWHCHIGINEKQDSLWVWHGDVLEFGGDCPALLAQLLIGLGAGYDW